MILHIYDELVRRPPHSPSYEANVPDSDHDDFVDSRSNRDLVPSGSDRGPLPSGTDMNDTNLSRSELLASGLRLKFPSRRYAIEGDGELNTLLSDEMIMT